MADDDPRDWDAVRADAIRAVTEAAEFANGYRVAGNAEVLADAVLAVVDEEAANRMAATLVDETRIRAVDFRNGVDMELEPSRTLVAHWVAAARTYLGEALNYVEAEVKLAGETDRFAFILQRVGPGKLTPHEARKQAEAERDAARAAIAELADKWDGEAAAMRAEFAERVHPALAHGHMEANALQARAAELRALLDRATPEGT